METKLAVAVASVVIIGFGWSIHRLRYMQKQLDVIYSMIEIVTEIQQQTFQEEIDEAFEEIIENYDD
jgi:hypothetical protein